jgi:tectonin-like protein/parallel beta helix pectate lyase-like protein
MRLAKIVLSGMFLLCLGTAFGQQTYYIKNGGLNTNTGLSDSQAWGDFTPVNNMSATPLGIPAGTVILLKRGSTWYHQELSLRGRGTPAQRILIRDYGTDFAPPIISRFQDVNRPRCVSAVDVKFLTIQNIWFESADIGINFEGTPNFASSVEVANSHFKDMDDRTIGANESAGIRLNGLGWDGVTITCCSFDTVTAGVVNVTGTQTTNLWIDGCEAFGGWGPGFALHNVNGGTVSNFRVHDVGGLSASGTTGGFIVSCENVLITDCSFSRVSHGGGPDGVGFDFEADNKNCQLSRSYFFDNEGPAILMLSGLGAPNTDIKIADCLFYNNNTVLHSGADPEADANLYQPYDPNQSTGGVTNCGSYTNSNSWGHFSSNWGGFGITGMIEGTYRQGWTPVYGTLKQLAVGGSGHVSGVDLSNNVLTWNGQYLGNCWTQVGSMLMRNVSIGNDGDLWGVDSSQAAWHYNYTLGSWTQTSFPPASPRQKVAAGSASNVWSIDPAGAASYWSASSSTWTAAPGVVLSDIDAGPAIRNAWGVGGASIYRFTANGWVTAPSSSSLTQISVHSDETLAGVDGTTVKRTINGAQDWFVLPGALMQVSEGSDGTLWGLDANDHVWRWR